MLHPPHDTLAPSTLHAAFAASAAPNRPATRGLPPMTARLAALRSRTGSITSFSSTAAGDGPDGAVGRAPELMKSGFGGTAGLGLRYDWGKVGAAGDCGGAGEDGVEVDAGFGIVGWLKCRRSRVLQGEAQGGRGWVGKRGRAQLRGAAELKAAARGQTHPNSLRWHDLQ